MQAAVHFDFKKNASTLFWCHQLRCWSRGLQLIPWILSLKSSTIAVCKRTQLYLFPKSVRKMFQSSTYLQSLHSESLHVVAMIFYYCIWWMEIYLLLRNWSLKKTWKEKTWGETNYCNLCDVVKESHVFYILIYIYIQTPPMPHPSCLQQWGIKQKLG